MTHPLFSALVLALPLALALAAPAQQNAGPYAPTAEERRQLQEKQRALAERLEQLAGKDTADAAVFLHAAGMAEDQRLYANKGHVQAVLRGLEIGLERCAALAEGKAPWRQRPGRSLRGFVSRIDGSVQPYAVVLPAGFDPAKGPWPLEVFLHGRGVTEVSFLQANEPAPGSKNAAAPEQGYVELHPFGRANNGWRWAGETDVFEALEQVRKLYQIDPNRTWLRGFSMGGHGAWHIGLHHPTLWSAVSPGAGFSETRKYGRFTDPVPPYWEAAWHIYDATDYARNLFNVPFTGYGGDKDPQLQATMSMVEAAAREGLHLDVVIGPNTEHKYHPDSLKEIMARLTRAVRNPDPPRVRFTTWTLKYNRCHWVTVEGLQEHYRRADVDAESAGTAVRVKTQNVTALSLDPLPAGTKTVEVDGEKLSVTGGPVRLERVGVRWKPLAGARVPLLRKKHGLQGPIDDAFTEKFLVVRGTGTPWSSAVQAYADGALQRFREEWSLGFRGTVPVKDDAAARDAELRGANLVLFGDPGSNRVLARIAGKLPIRWTPEGVRVGKQSYGPDHVPVLIYPNPLNPERYVVINTGHTFGRKEILASNVQLFPRLADWAILKPGAGAPEVAAADFFDEYWRLKPGR